ncbi:hypothetical protein TorRG33x02_168780, partial [Trema orientale]
MLFSSNFFTGCGFLHSMKLRVPCDPIVSRGLRATNQKKKKKKNQKQENRIRNQSNNRKRKSKNKQVFAFWVGTVIEFRDRLTISSGIGAVEKEAIEIGAEDWEAALAGVGLQGGVDDGRDELVLVDDEANRAGAAEHGDADQEPVALGALTLLLLVVQHRNSTRSLPNFPQTQNQNISQN